MPNDVFRFARVRYDSWQEGYSRRYGKWQTDYPRKRN